MKKIMQTSSNERVFVHSKFPILSHHNLNEIKVCYLSLVTWLCIFLYKSIIEMFGVYKFFSVVISFSFTYRKIQVSLYDIVVIDENYAFPLWQQLTNLCIWSTIFHLVFPMPDSPNTSLHSVCQYNSWYMYSFSFDHN